MTYFPKSIAITSKEEFKAEMEILQLKKHCVLKLKCVNQFYSKTVHSPDSIVHVRIWNSSSILVAYKKWMNLIAHYLKQEKYCYKYEQNENFIAHKKNCKSDKCVVYISAELKICK